MSYPLKKSPISKQQDSCKVLSIALSAPHVTIPSVMYGFHSSEGGLVVSLGLRFQRTTCGFLISRFLQCWSIAFSLFPLGWYSYTFSEVTWFAHCVVKTYATQSSFEPNCLFCIKRDGNHPLANFWPGMPRLTFHLAILLWKSHVKIFLSNAY